MSYLRHLLNIWVRLRLFKTIGFYNRSLFCVGGQPDLNIQGSLSFVRNRSVAFVNNSVSSTLGINRKCKLLVYKNASLHFKGRVGMSNTVIVATKHIEIGDNVMIGGGVTIVDCDFHSKDYHDWFTENDEKNMPSKPVVIGNNVFIGMNTIILKGVTVGDGAVIGAGSVVSSNIPSNEIWAGNPAKFIKKRNSLPK